jgi:hypothetical protein
MTAPTVPTLPPAPSRNSASPDAYIDIADAWAAALPAFGDAIKTVGTFVETQAGGAETAKTTATTAAGNAQTYASNASASADAASTSATSAAGSAGTAAGWKATSTTSMVIGTGAKSLTIQAGKQFSAGTDIKVVRTSAPSTTYVFGVVDTYNSSTGALAFTVASGDTAGSGTFTDWTVSLAGSKGATGAGIALGATGSDIRTGTATDRAVTPGALKDATAFVALTDASSIATDMSSGVNFKVTLAGNRTLANPTNLKISQDGTGSRTLAYGSAWKFPGGSQALSTGANKVDAIAYIVVDASTPIIRATLIKDFI